jgi:tetratricopeptide (TPR) repeat protein
VAIALLGFATCSPVSAAPAPDKFPPDPLEITKPDPLLPATERPLTAEEQTQLAAALDTLNAQAAAQLKAGNSTAAFDLWNRELRLRRALGLLAEVKALGRVGSTAWGENQASEVQVITKRLQAIDKQVKAQPIPDLAVWKALGQAYEQVRSPGLALNAYQQILTQVRQQGDPAAETATLNTIAQLHSSWFDFAKAAATYQELLTLTQTQSNTASPAQKRQQQVAYLQELAYIYEKAKQPEQAIAIQQQLVNLYQNEKDLSQVPALKQAIAANYQALGQLDQAEQTYKEGYALAQSLQQLYNASESLQQLGDLYRTNNKLEDALRVYEFLVSVEQQSYNLYGMMNTYDQVGQINLARKAYPQALEAFQKGLELAQQLKYQEAYFAQQIEQVTQQSPR